MTFRNSRALRFKPRGVVDAIDGMNISPGGMSSLQNLISDPSTPFSFQCRPAATTKINFTQTGSPFSSPGVVSAAIEVNGHVYGLISSSRTAGMDEPFCYEVSAATFNTVSGITSANVPNTPAATGDWTPPSMAVLGSFIVVTHPGFSGSNGYFGYFDISGFSNISSGNTVSGSPIITGNHTLAGIMPGYTVSGTNIPIGARVVDVANVTQTGTGTTTSGSTSVTAVTVYMPVGEVISGSNIVTGTTVANITGSAGNYTITLSQNATGSGSITLYGTGTTITMSVNATGTANGTSITIAGGSASSPLWSSCNTTMNGLIAVPSFVSVFYDRFYFAINNYLFYTDTFSLNRTLASQSVTIGDAGPITALTPFTISTVTQGMVSGLLAFKKRYIAQVTGDAALSTLAVNDLNLAEGTDAPRSVVATPNGVYFKSSDGIRVVAVNGSVSEANVDLRLPFLNALYPSRISGAYNTDIYRICVQNGGVANSPWEEYWFDIGRNIWTGPHTFQQDLAIPHDNGFILFSHINTAKGFMSEVIQSIGVGFTELDSSGVSSHLSWIYETSPVGEETSMNTNSSNATTINAQIPSGMPSISCVASDESTGVISNGIITNSTNTASLWGFFTWGVSLWYGAQYGMRPHLVPWTKPLVFTKLVFKATSESVLGFKISNLRVMVQLIDYYPPV